MSQLPPARGRPVDVTPLRSLHLLLLVVLAGGALVTPAAGAAGPETGIADDRVLLAGGAAADDAGAQWAALGVDVVRPPALCPLAPPAVAATAPPAAFDAADPDSPGCSWAALAESIARVSAAVLRV